MFITQQQLNQILDNHFIDYNGNFDQQHFDHSLQIILDNHHDLYDEMHNPEISAHGVAFEALRRFAQDACEGEYGEVQGLTLPMLVQWNATHFQHFTFGLLSNTITYIQNERAEAQKEEEDSTMYNNIITENIETTEVRYCAECGCIITGEAHEVDGKWYCDDCYDANFVECGRCGTIHRLDDMIWIESEDRHVCDDCLDRYYTRCERCDEYVRNYNTFHVQTDTDGTTEVWCDDCAENYSWCCDECDTRYSEYVPDNGCCMCDDCYSEGLDTGDINSWKSPRRRMNYGYKPVICPCATSAEKDAAGSSWEKKVVIYGTELEIDRDEACGCEDEWSANIVDHLFNSYCKTDCSLDRGGSYSGIEIVSHPGTLAWYEEHRQMYKDCFDMLKRGGWLSHDAETCGLHVHISLHALEQQNDFAINNMLYIFDRFWDKFVKFSRRTHGQLDHWARRYSTAHGNYEDIKHMAKSERDRYMAVNLENTHTVELRMWRGTLNLETFFATLQMVDVICKRCVEIGRDYRRLQSITWDELVKSDHADLNAYLERRNLLNTGATLSQEEIKSEIPDVKDSRPADAFRVGDRVRVVSSPDRYDELIGHEGIVLYVDTATRFSVAVDFSGCDDRNILTMLHYTHGNPDTQYGWCCEPNSLEIIESDSEITSDPVNDVMDALDLLF